MGAASAVVLGGRCGLESLQWPGLVFRRRYPLSAGGRQPQPAGQFHHVTKPDQPGTMFGGDYCWRFAHSACLTDYKQGRKLIVGEFFRFGHHHPSMASFSNYSVVKFAQIDE
jgi:hypothetical protein